MKRTLSFVVLMLCLVSVPAFATNGWGSYHWSRSCGTCPAALTIYDSTSATARANWPDHLYKSVYGDPGNPNIDNRLGWNDSLVLDLTITSGGVNRKCAAVAGAIRVCNGTYGFTGWLGLAQIWLGGGHISQATTKVNDTYFNDSYPITEQRHVMCQEIGHDFGLGHTSENGTTQNSCMDYYQNTSDSDWTSTGPNVHDFLQLEIQHHWGTANLTADPSEFSNAMTEQARIPVYLQGIELTEPWQWGVPVEWDRNGRPVTFFLKTGTNHGEHEDGVLTHTYPVRDYLPLEPREQTPAPAASILE